MQLEDLVSAGASAGAVAMVLMFKMYIDKRRKSGAENPAIMEEVKELRRDIEGSERRAEMKPLAEAINGLTIAVREMHTSQQMQMKILETISHRMMQGGVAWKERKQ